MAQERQSVDELLKRADLAMYEAKAAAGRNTHRFFDPGMQQALHERSSLEADLRQGLQRGEFMHYQAVVDHQGHIKGAEALARWNHPERGAIRPSNSSPWPNRPASILPLGSTSCTPPASSSCAGRSPGDRPPERRRQRQRRQFRQPDFAAEVLHTLRETGANPRRLKLELTESLLLGDIEDTIGRMVQLGAKAWALRWTTLAPGIPAWVPQTPAARPGQDRPGLCARRADRPGTTQPSCAPFWRWRKAWTWTWWPKGWRRRAAGLFAAAWLRAVPGFLFGRPGRWLTWRRSSMARFDTVRNGGGSVVRGQPMLMDNVPEQRVPGPAV